MMIKQITILVTLLFVFLLPIQSFSQVEPGIIDPEDFNHQLLSKLITTKINQKRDSIGVHKLEIDSSLVKAAKHHADYIKETGRLSHRQRRRRYSTPAKRAEQFGAEFTAVAENIAFVSAGPTVIRGTKREFTFNTYEEVAEDLVRNWINSPGHYKNIADKDMEKTGVAVAYDERTNIVYAVQVFTRSGKPGRRSLSRLLRSLFF